MRKAVQNVNETIAPDLVGHDILDQRGIDQAMIALDGTPNKATLGANAILAVSIACARAAANHLDIPLYRYLGRRQHLAVAGTVHERHQRWAARRQYGRFPGIHVAPHGAESFAEAIRKGEETFHALKAILHGKGYSTGVGEEGSFAPDLKSNEEAVEVILEAIVKAGLKPGEEVSLCLDPATSEMWENGKYVHFKSAKSTKTSEEMVKLWESWVGQYPSC